MYLQRRGKISKSHEEISVQIPIFDTSNNSHSSLLQSKYHFTVGGNYPKKLFHVSLWNENRQNKFI
jgi:hypothetical protein